MEGRANGRNPMEENMTKFRTAGLALAGILAITAASATDASAQWRRHGGYGWGPAVGIGAGVAAGALIGSAVAGSAYGPGYYYGEPAYGYGPVYSAPVYAQPYGYEPVYPADTYYAPTYRSGGYGQCFTDEGNGRRRPCSAQ
jgi:hypothetical protein